MGDLVNYADHDIDRKPTFMGRLSVTKLPLCSVALSLIHHPSLGQNRLHIESKRRWRLCSCCHRPISRSVGSRIVGEGTVAVSVRIMRKVAMTRIVGCILMYLVRSPATDKSFARYLGLSCSCLVAVLCEHLGIVDNR